jgi:pyridoxamine 5'-phosphate oxidase-like protein
MTDIPQSHRDLLDQPVAVVGTIDPEGRPRSTIVWFLADEPGDERVVVTVKPTRVNAVDMTAG